jgi:hypothetical protein
MVTGRGAEQLAAPPRAGLHIDPSPDDPLQLDARLVGRRRPDVFGVGVLRLLLFLLFRGERVTGEAREQGEQHEQREHGFS